MAVVVLDVVTVVEEVPQSQQVFLLACEMSGDHVIAGVLWAGPGGNGEATVSIAGGGARAKTSQCLRFDDNKYQTPRLQRQHPRFTGTGQRGHIEPSQAPPGGAK